MTTDTVKKECAVTFPLGGVTCTLGGMAMGSGMIAPNMATMLCFLTTDAAVEAGLLKEALSEVVEDTFNMMSVDGDTSTNDMVTLMANGAAGGALLTEKNEEYAVFTAALRQVCTALCRALAADGEGATKLLECRVSGAKSDRDACTAAKAVINSALFKSAMFGADANWGRVLCAIGYSGASVDVTGVAVSFARGGTVTVCEKGAGVPFSEEEAKRF